MTQELTFRAATEADMPFLLVERVLARFECAEIVLLSGKPVGLLKAARDGNKWDLIQIQILPEKQGTGLGTGILRKLLDEAVRSQAAVTLSVLKSNPARRLYERLGFRIVGENDQAYDMEFGAW